jgi:hypothetical protein
MVGILISRKISPYLRMVAGLEEALAQRASARIFLDESGKPYSQ